MSIENLIESNKSSLPESLIVSFPKAGRTWITFFISRVLQKRFNLDENDLVFTEKIAGSCPCICPITVTHYNNPHNKSVGMLSQDKSVYKDKKIMLLIRDPRDIIVSWYFHKNKRKKETEQYSGSLSQFLNEKVGSFDTIIEYYNIWERNKHIPLDFLSIKYEDFMKDTRIQAKKVLNFIGLKDVSNREIEGAIEFSSFNNMKKMEAEDRFKIKRLRPGDVNDNDSYKVRRGVIGGYKDYLSQGNIQNLNEKMKHLSRYYGYSP